MFCTQLWFIVVNVLENKPISWFLVHLYSRIHVIAKVNDLVNKTQFTVRDMDLWSFHLQGCQFPFPFVYLLVPLYFQTFFSVFIEDVCSVWWIDDSKWQSTRTIRFCFLHSSLPNYLSLVLFLKFIMHNGEKKLFL